MAKVPSISDSDLTSAFCSRDTKKAGMVTYVSALFYGVGGIVVAGVALLVAFQEKLVYVPVLPGLSKSYPITPARLNLIYEDVWLQSSDGVRLHAWFIKMFPECRGPFSFLIFEFRLHTAHRSCVFFFWVDLIFAFREDYESTELNFGDFRS